MRTDGDEINPSSTDGSNDENKNQDQSEKYMNILVIIFTINLCLFRKKQSECSTESADENATKSGKFHLVARLVRALR